MIDYSQIITAEDKERQARREEQERINREAREVLDSTDWYIVRELETGKPIPETILAQRQEARDKIVEVLDD